jgi:predicted permease
MKKLREILFRLRALFRRENLDAEMREEMQHHLEMTESEKIEDGLPPEEARYAGQRKFGGVAQVQEQCRDQRGWLWLEQLMQDVRFSGRMLRKNPIFIVVAVSSLAIGIGVNTAIFSVLHRVFFEGSALERTEGLVYIYQSDAKRSFSGHSFPAYETYRERSDLFSGVLGLAGERPMALGAGTDVSVVYVAVVTGNYFSVLGINPFAGRVFLAEDDRAGAGSPVVVLSHDCWQRQFHSDPAIVGRTVSLNDSPFQVVGIAPPGFGRDTGVSMDFWMPLSTWAQLAQESARFQQEGHRWLSLIGRLKSGVTLEQAQGVLTTLMTTQHRLPDDGPGARVTLRRVSDGDPMRRKAFWDDGLPIGAIAFVVGGMVLLVASANVANLLLARGASRRREIAVRLALGCSRGRILRQLLAESVWISALAGAASFLVARWALDLLLALKPPTPVGHAPLPTLALNFELNPGVCVFGALISLAAGVAFGLAPAWQSARADLLPGLNGAPPRGNPLRWDLRNLLVVAQIAVCFVLLAGGGQLLRGWFRAHALNPGFEVDNVLLLSLAPKVASQRKSPEFARELLRRVNALPGVRAASVADPVPPSFGGNFAWFAADRGDDAPSERLGYAKIAPRYFAAMEIPLLRGRDFNDGDTAASPSVAIVNETLAQRFWPGVNPLGQQLRRGNRRIEVVGVARGSSYHRLGESAVPWLYVPALQERDDSSPQLTLVVRTERDPMGMVASLKREVLALDPAWPIFEFRTLRQNMALQLFVPQVMATLLGLLGLFGTILATIGVFGLVSYAVICRTREIGLRIAVGATATDILAMVLKHGVVLATTGSVLGAAIAVPLGWLLFARLSGVTPNDWPAFVGTALLLVIATLLAGFLPARRAARIDPMVALRAE